MKFVEVEQLPPKNTQHEINAKKPVKDFLDELMATNIKIARVDYRTDEYKNFYTAHSVFRRIIKQCGYPIKVHLLQGVVYLERVDL